MNGLKEVSYSFQYVRFVISFCDSSKYTYCVDKNELQRIISGGRLFMFIEKPDSVNLASFKKQDIYKF